MVLTKALTKSYLLMKVLRVSPQMSKIMAILMYTMNFSQRHTQEETDYDEVQGTHSAKHGRTRKAKSEREPKPARPNPIARLANHWFDRVMGAISDGSISDQQEEYAAHRTSRDYIWNTVGVGAWGMVFPVLTIVATQLAGAEQAGMFSMAFVTGTLLMIIANFGVRTYQVSDVEEKHSFMDYQINRWITCVLMVLVGAVYCTIRGYDSTMFYISLGVYLYKMIDGLADVYEGRLQQVDKLYLAGISQALRSIAALVVFSLLLLITHNMIVASFGMAIAAATTFVVVTFPLTLLETPKAHGWSMGSVGALFKNCAPLFVALFLYAVIDNMPKFVMEGMLSYDNQLYFNALYFPAQGILLTVQLVYKPLLVRMANVWNDPAKRKKFDLIIIGIMLLIVVVTVANIVIMGWIGLAIMSFLYGIDFEQFRGLCFIMLAAGGVTAAIDFLYQIITVMRRQKDVTKLYIITLGFSLFVPTLLVMFTGLPGAVISYLIVMSILLVLLVWEYFRIRSDLAKHPEKAYESTPKSTHEPVYGQPPKSTHEPVYGSAHEHTYETGDAGDGVSATPMTSQYSHYPETSEDFEESEDLQEPSARHVMRLPEIGDNHKE